MNKFWIGLLGILLLSGCGASRSGVASGPGPYGQYYHSKLLDTANVIYSTEEPQLLAGSNPEADILKMMENGYALLGYSAFTGPQANTSQAIEQAKRIQADKVIVYSNYRETISGARPITIPDIRTSMSSGQSTAFGSAFGSGGYATGYTTAFGTGTTTSYGTRTIYKPYEISRFDQIATYWVKERHSFGAIVIDLPLDLRQKIGSNKGVVVVSLVKPSPAFSADILPGDVIKKINNVEINDRNYYLQNQFCPAKPEQRLTV
jgi:hypothetical protein